MKNLGFKIKSDKNFYQYKAQVVRVIDGDTVEALIHLGFSVYRKDKIRIYGINASELKSKDNLIFN